jgi:hypothetical protein
MKRPTFITMSTLAFTLVAYVALTQMAQAEAAWALDLRGCAPEAVGTAAPALPLSWNHTGASVRR